MKIDISKLRKEQPRDFDALVAEKILGWEWLERKSHGMKALFPKEVDGWLRVNFFEKNWIPAKEETERYTDWDKVSNRVNDKGNIVQWGLPKYSLSVADDYELLQNILKNWKERDIIKVSVILESIWQDRFRKNNDETYKAALLYTVGDYSEAALRCILGE